ncbi:hypothetical protein PtA15_5A472 [Puccinia triticina]|uniref:Uncharacterized protein n=1 Tax=Puccinia triticina TaxID=208348 RepID=A0ABY7CI38_9BASI|nr:uncharacterized protein PtA15_5A472 [Puccinia triticina]WAQ84899.1 hypothetical protein PtA15_5A472 [Puccinia triticina]
MAHHDWRFPKPAERAHRLNLRLGCHSSGTRRQPNAHSRIDPVYLRSSTIAVLEDKGLLRIDVG